MNKYIEFDRESGAKCSHPKVVKSWIWGGGAPGNEKSFVSIILDSGKEIQFGPVENIDDAFIKANEFLNKLDEDDVDLLKKRVKELEEKLAEARKIIKDPSKSGYYSLCRMLYQQLEYLDEFDIKAQITANPKDDKVYERAKGIWESLKTMIMDCRYLKDELMITAKEEEEVVKRYKGTTPESIAESIGGKAGQI